MKSIIINFVKFFNIFLDKFLIKSNIFIVYRFGNAIGDQVCMSAVVKALKEQKGYKIIVFSSYPELFYNNPNIFKNINIKKYPLIIQKIIKKILDLSNSNNIENFLFKYKNSSLEKYMRETKSKNSLIEAHSLHFREKLNLKNTKPEIYFNKEEIKQFEKKFKELDNFAIIQPVGKTTYTPNKEWGFEKYQEVVNRTKDKINWIQVGLKNEKLLDNVKDFRGETQTLRELAYIIKKAKFVLSNEGLLNHLATAVGTKSFVIFSGFSQVELAKYDTTIPIVRNPQVECAPCWLREKCPQEKKWCTEDISVEIVSNIIKIGY